MLFSALPDGAQADLRRDAVPRTFAAGQLIQQRGDDPAGFWLIESGTVAIGQYLASGEFRGVALLRAGDSWGELALFARRPRVVDAVARTACVALHVPATRFEAALAANPAAMRTLLGALSQQLQETLEVVAAIRRGSARTRIAGLLLTLHDSGEGSGPISISQQELGELLGLTRVSVNAGLRHFEACGMVRRGYRAIEVIDRAGLGQAALE